ncbi:peroxidase-related enzyme [Tomitella gaofuii]|uniref:peroxidase-related enzyme n=1 Tax=Tomitella gaofuii TaxID=2760083 RepID=UPI0015F886BC|nr:peroxidase-related enzyme [Tomitella gaofuii]
MDQQPQPFFPVPRETDLPSGLQKLFGKAREQIGFLPNVFLAYARRPERFSAWFNHFREVTAPTETLDAADREMIAVVVSNINHCTYCMVSHGYSLAEALGDRAQADLISINWRHAGLDPRRRAICAYAEKLTSAPDTVERQDLEDLRAAGLTDDDVWDVVEIAAMYNFTNRVSSAMGHRPNPEYHRRPPAAAE